MAKCSSCFVSVRTLYKRKVKSRFIWMCTACCSRLNNKIQLGRTSSLSRLALFSKLAYIIGNLATNKGRKRLVDLLNKDITSL